MYSNCSALSWVGTDRRYDLSSGMISQALKLTQETDVQKSQSLRALMKNWRRHVNTFPFHSVQQVPCTASIRLSYVLRKNKAYCINPERRESERSSSSFYDSPHPWLCLQPRYISGGSRADQPEPPPSPYHSASATTICRSSTAAISI